MKPFLSNIDSRLCSIWMILFIMGLSGGVPGTIAADDSFAIRSGAEVDYPPFSMVDENGQATGFSVDLIRAAMHAMGRTVTFRTGPWAEVKGWLEQGAIQALPLVGRTPEREHLFDFTFPFMTLHGAIVIREGTTSIRDLKDLRGRHVAVMAKDNAEEFLRRQDRGIFIHTTDTFETALRELSRGRFDAVFTQQLVARRLIQKAGLINLQIVQKPVDGFSQEFCFAVKEGDKDTLALLNEGLSLVIADGTYRYLHAKWFAALELPTRNRIIVGGDHNYPPYEYRDENGRPAGYNVDLTRAIARELGLDITIRLGPWTEILPALKTGEIDILQGMLYSPERDLNFDFSPAHTVNHCVGVVRKGEYNAPETIRELKGKRMVVQQGDIMHDFVLQNGFKDQVSALETQEEALRELAAGKHDCALVSRLTALYLIEKHGWSHLVLGKIPLLSPEYCYSVPNNRKAILAEFSEGLKILEGTGEYRKIQEKWMGIYEGVSPDFSRILRYIVIVIAFLVIVLFGFLLWSWMLRRQVTLRTEALRKSEEFQRAMIDCSPVALYSLDFKGVVLTWNTSAERMFGWKAEEAIGKRLPIIPDDKDEEFSDLLRQAIEGNRFVGKEVLRAKKDGTRFMGSLSVAPILDASGRTVAIMCAMEEITFRKQAEQALKRNESLLNLTQRISKIGGWEWDVVSKEMFWTEETYRIHDFDTNSKVLDSQDLIAKSIACYSDEDRLRIQSAFERCVEKGTPYELECRFITGKGRHLWISTTGHAVRKDDRIIKVHGNIQDITERKQAEQQLLDQNQFIRTILDNLPIGLAVNNTDTNKTTYINKQFEAIYGWPKKDLETVGSFFENVYPDKDYREQLIQRVMADIQSGEIKRMAWEGIEATAKDGSKRIISAKNIPIVEQNIMISTVQDITESRNLHNQLVQAQKMESVGRLAGGVAHDFNNMLTVILGYTEAALEGTDPEEPLHGHLSQILNAARRSTDMTRQLLGFARQQTITPQILDLNEAVEKILSMIRRLIGEDIHLLWKPAKSLWPVNIDPSQIDQILANLCVNARDAIADTGKIIIETGKVTLDETYCADHPGFSPGEFVLLAASDDGCGMDKNILGKLFEPYFTTKEVGKGTGLGLATVYGIVKQNNGFINVYSEPGQGTTFRIYLPRHTSDEPAMDPKSTKPIPSGQGEVVLIAEDEESILELLEIMLETLGYTVLSASSPGQAIQIAEEQAGQIDLLITDVVMPEMNGRDLAEKVKTYFPDVKIIFMSGYTANVIAHQGVLDEDVLFIQKPFSADDLAARIHEALKPD